MMTHPQGHARHPRRVSAAAILACGLLALGACSDARPLYSDASDRIVVFSVDYVNGFTPHGTYRSGLYIDEDGWVYRYETNDVEFAGPDTYLAPVSADQLMALFSQKRELLGQIDVDTLARRVTMVPVCAEGELVAHWPGIFDTGLATYSAYLYDRDVDSYQRITLRVRGDHEVDNSTAESKFLADWLWGVVGDYCDSCMR